MVSFDMCVMYAPPYECQALFTLDSTAALPYIRRNMKTAKALAFFNENQSKLARALEVTRASVNSWGAVVPLDKALALATLTGGRLRVDLSLYPAIRSARLRASNGVKYVQKS